MHTVTIPALGSTGMEVGPTFNVVLVYEDLETGKRAMRTYDYLIEQLGGECLFANQMWKFDLLIVSKLREMAARDAAAADIVIVSAHEGNELPDEVKRWAELWAPHKTKTIALVGLFDADASVATPVRDFMEHIARRARVEFFSQPGLWPGQLKAAAGVPAPQRSQKTFSILANMVQDEPTFSHWGINE